MGVSLYEYLMQTRSTPQHRRITQYLNIIKHDHVNRGYFFGFYRHFFPVYIVGYNYNTRSEKRPSVYAYLLLCVDVHRKSHIIIIILPETY